MSIYICAHLLEQYSTQFIQCMSYKLNYSCHNMYIKGLMCYQKSPAGAVITPVNDEMPNLEGPKIT